MAGAQHVPRHALGSCRVIAGLGLAARICPPAPWSGPAGLAARFQSEAVRFIAGLGLAGTHLRRHLDPARQAWLPGSGPTLSGSSPGSAWPHASAPTP
jgi:hypothetical protein